MNDHRIDMKGGEHAVLLIHGLTGSPFELKPLAKKLHKNGFTVKAPCLAGHGTTVANLISTTWLDWYATVQQEFLELKREHETVSVAGLCMGALLALYLTYKEQYKVSSLAVLSTTFFYDGWSLPWYRFLLPLSYHPLIRYLHSYSYEEREPYGIKNERWREQKKKLLKDNSVAYSHFPSQSMHELFKLIKTVKNIIHGVTVPTLILHALEDDLASIRNADFVERNIGSATVRKVLLKDTYHMLTLDNQKDCVADESISFFRAAAPFIIPSSASR
ncbi:MAG TPA: alpha/beta fold hydrolase [Thermodesulfovibrionales bacterium]|nr:alpha/beta fold hydrolase [Thermodesulfovibrionales bacterium]